jgi:hypothetical protein
MTLNTTAVNTPRPLTRDSIRQVNAAVRNALALEAGTPSDPAHQLVITDDEQAEFVRAARIHRVAGLLHQHDEALGLPEQVAAALQRTTFQQTKSAMKLTLETVRAYEAMTDAGVPTLVMKGIPLSLLTTGTLDARGGGDVDLLVPVEYIATAHRALESAGWESLRGGAPRPGATWRLVAWVNRELPFQGPDSAADLHWRVDYDHHLFRSPETLIARATTVDLAGHPVPTLNPGDALAACCLHIYIDGCAQLRGLVDLIRLSRLDGAHVPDDASPQLRRLIAEIGTFTAQRVGDMSEGRLNGLGANPHPDTRYFHELWTENSPRAVHVAGESLPWSRFDELYRHQGRYSQSQWARAGRFLTNYSMSAAHLDPSKGTSSVGKAVSVKAREVVWHRLLRQQGSP